MPLKDLCVMANAPQSASHQALKVKVCIALSNILCLGFHIIYPTTQMAASQCSFSGAYINLERVQIAYGNSGLVYIIGQFSQIVIFKFLSQNNNQTRK